MTLREARKILRMPQHKGEMAALARKLNVKQPSLTDVLDGKKTSARILAAVLSRAEELARVEATATAAAQALLRERICA